MNIFLDTCILYKDPYFLKNLNKEFFELVKKKKINLFVSNVVVLELERNYKKIVDENNKLLNQVIGKGIDYMLVDRPVSIINKEESVNNLVKFYNSLVEDGFLTILYSDNNLLPEIIERSVNKLKPFSENKTELNDTIIWLTYTRYVEENDIQDCMFLTDNVTDFCDIDLLKKEIVEVHNDLKRDSKRFRIYRNIKELMKAESDKLFSFSQGFSNWLSTQNINGKLVFDILKKYFSQVIYDKVNLFCVSRDLKQIFNFIDNVLGLISVTKIRLDFCDDITIDTFEDNCLISGYLFMIVSVDGYIKKTSKENYEDVYTEFDSTEVSVRLFFSFLYDIEEIPSDFGIDHIEILRQ